MQSTLFRIQGRLTDNVQNDYFNYQSYGQITLLDIYTSELINIYLFVCFDDLDKL